MILEPVFDLRRIFRTTSIVNGALVAGLFLDALVVELVKSQFKPFAGFFPELNLPFLRYVFYGAAVGAVVLTRITAKALTRAGPGEDVQHLGHRLSRASIATGTVAELPAVLGFVLFLIAGFVRDFYYLLFVSLFLEFMYFPRFKAWQDLIREKFPKGGDIGG
jgi:predicted small secreted protein